MTQVDLPLTMYSIRATAPSTPYGARSTTPLLTGVSYAPTRFSMDKIPSGATIQSAEIVLTVDRALPSGYAIAVAPITAVWSASVTYSKRPPNSANVGSVATDATKRTYTIPVSSWAATRPKNGFIMATTSPKAFNVYGLGSAHPPVLRVNYTQVPLQPNDLSPDDGAVSIAKPQLSYGGDDDMTEQLIEINYNGVVWSSGWKSAVDGFFDQPDEAPTPGAGERVSWRATVRNTYGTSTPSEWATYSYVPLPVGQITSPGDVVADGSPPFIWECSDQAAWFADLIDLSTGKVIDSSTGYRTDSETRDWTPLKGVRVPRGSGRARVRLRDSVTRVAAPGAPTEIVLTHDFVTSLDGYGDGMSDLQLSYDEPAMVLRCRRPAGVPDQVSVLRDGVQVTLWDNDGMPVTKIPGPDVYEDGVFTLRDYTCPAKGRFTWTVVAWTNNVPSTDNATVTETVFAHDVWLLDPRTGDKAAIKGNGDAPAVSQTVAEASILHTPITGSGTVEPVRRRVNRTTKSGTISGVLLDEDSDLVEQWVMSPAGDRYRLVFGRQNLPVIIGDYVPNEVTYGSAQWRDKVLIEMNWWERLRDF